MLTRVLIDSCFIEEKKSLEQIAYRPSNTVCFSLFDKLNNISECVISHLECIKKYIFSLPHAVNVLHDERVPL